MTKLAENLYETIESLPKKDKQDLYDLLQEKKEFKEWVKKQPPFKKENYVKITEEALRKL